MCVYGIEWNGLDGRACHARGQPGHPERYSSYYWKCPTICLCMQTHTLMEQPPRAIWGSVSCPQKMAHLPISG